MATYTKSISGAWAKAGELKSGSKAKIVSETAPQESQFKDKDGNPKKQDVCKVRFEGQQDALNVSLNRATIYGLIDAFGNDSKSWIGKELTVHTEKVVVGGKRVTTLYLVPEGFEVKENDAGFLEVVKTGGETTPVDPLDELDGVLPEDGEIEIEA